MRIGFITAEDFVEGNLSEKMKLFSENNAKDKIDSEHRKSLKKAVEESCDMEVYEENKDNIIALDLSTDRDLQFNFLDTLDYSQLFEFNSLKVNKPKFYRLIEKLDRNLFLTVKKIIFINDRKEYGDMVKEFGKDEEDSDDYEYIDLKHELGKHIFYKSTVIINMLSIRRTIKEMIKESDYYIDKQEELNIAIFTTLIHELRHNYQVNPLFEEKFIDMSNEEMEMDSENYCRNQFEENIRCEDYFIFK